MMTPLDRAQHTHQAAMDLAEDAFLAARRGDRAVALELYRRAYQLEARAADYLARCPEVEPTRSILYRSAATMALRCRELDAAHQLAAQGLAGQPPQEIADELREVFVEAEEEKQSFLASPPPAPDGPKLYFTGVNRKGAYLTPPASWAKVVERAFKDGWKSPPEWILKDHDLEDPRRAPSLFFKRPWDLAETGWGVVFAPDLDRRVRTQLEELLEHRRRQAGRVHSDYFQEYTYSAKSAFDFLKDNKAKPGSPANPDYLPYHLLLVGHPDSIPYQVQSELDASYAVGRLWFDRVEDYGTYARNLVRAEEQWRRRSQEVAFFGPEHPGDRSTQKTCRELVQGLAQSVIEPGMPWQARTLAGDEARKERLRALLGGAETPAFLFAACHGLGLEPEDAWQEALQGALVCQDWPGPADEDESGVGDEHIFAATDLLPGASLNGLVAFLYACYGLGTPQRDNFHQDDLTRARPIAPKPLVSRLPQRLLASGALAVIGHVDRAWTASFEGSPKGEGLDALLYLVRYLLKGYTVGSVMELLNQSYSTLAAMQGNIEEAWRYREPVDRELWTRLWLLRNDARNFMVFGDPAVRLQGVGDPP